MLMCKRLPEHKLVAMRELTKHPMHKDNACQEKPHASLISLFFNEIKLCFYKATDTQFGWGYQQHYIPQVLGLPVAKNTQS